MTESERNTRQKKYNKKTGAAPRKKRIRESRNRNRGRQKSREGEKDKEQKRTYMDGDEDFDPFKRRFFPERGIWMGRGI